MERLIFIFLLDCIFVLQLNAIPAYPRIIKKNINGIETPIRLYGDEHFKRVESEEGYTIVQDDVGDWFYAQLNSMGRLVPSSFKVGTISSALKDFISSIPIHLSEKAQNVERKLSRGYRQPAVGQRRMLIIMMEFPDKKFKKTEQDFDKLFNQVDYCDDGAQGSVRDFFYRSSYGQLVLSCDIFGPYQTALSMSNYGRNSILGGGDSNPSALFEEAIEKVSKTVDLHAYDGDNDGYIDNVHIIYAGYGEEAGGPSNAIWAHEATFVEPYEIQGLKIDHYSCAPELRGNSGNGISRIGPHCHEIGHALGALDFYDADYADGGQYIGTGEWDLMAAGSWNNDGITPADVNPYVKAFCYGWVDVQLLPKGNVIIPPSDTNRDNYYMINHGMEYYLFENRNPQKYDDGLPGKGLLVFHVHYGIEDAGNKINVTTPQKCYVVCASANTDIPQRSSKEYGDINSAGCPYPGNSNNSEFSDISTPKAFWWNGDNCGILINDIHFSSNGSIALYNGSSESGSVMPTASEVYFDGFETEKNYTVLSSTQSVWERIRSNGLVDMVAGRPLAYEGNYSLQLSARNRISSSVCTLGFHCVVSSNAKTVQLSGYFASKGLNRGLANLIKIGWRSKDREDWEYYDYEVPVNDVWTPFVLRIAPSSELQFAIEGTAQAGCVLALDNLRVDQQIVTGVREQNLPHVSTTEIYSFSGQKKTHFSKGLNIIKQKDGTTKKVFVNK